jgi:hypothetical protein
LVLALAKRDAVVNFLVTEYGFPQPLCGTSGNGGHAVWKIDLPNDDVTRDLIQRFYLALDQRFSNDQVTIDRTVFNAARIWKLYGTLARKGDPVPSLERIHRRSAITDLGEDRLVSVEQITQVAALYQEPQRHAPAPTLTKPSAQGNQGEHAREHFDIEAWMTRNNILYVREKHNDGRTIYVLNVCPFNPDHTDQSAVITQDNDGKLGFTCHHHGCAGKNWKALRELKEPGVYDRKRNTNASDQGQRLIKLADDADLFRTPDGEVYARCAINGHYEVWAVGEKGSGFRSWLVHRYYIETGAPASQDAIAKAMDVLRAKAQFESAMRPIFTFSPEWPTRTTLSTWTWRMTVGRPSLLGRMGGR